MFQKQKSIIFCIVTIICMFAVIPNVYAMHIMEGYLPPRYCIAWGVVSIPFLLWGLHSIQNILQQDRKNITLLAMSGAFIFVLSSLKIPSITGSCSHMTGTALGAILFGFAPISVLGMIVLLFQAILLAHGGLTTLGANVFSMAIAGSFLTYIVFQFCKKCSINKKISIFIAAFLGDLFTYCITSIQLAFAYPSIQGGISASIMKFLSVFAPTQLPLAIIEGILTVMIIIVLETYAIPEMRLIGFINEEVQYEQKK
ncbi:energy-coupling factor ABC transporter permease [Lachnospiraceae bacterium 46-61]